MKRLTHAVLALAVGTGVLASAAPLGAQAKPAPAPAPAAQAPAKPKYVAPIKGIAEIGYLAPQTKVVGNEVVTTFKVKNLSTGSIALLRVDEFWWDKANQAVGGATYRHKKLLLPGEVIDVELRNPKNPNFFRNNYQFSHANGTIKPKVLKTLE
jgi:hypothetical protein